MAAPVAEPVPSVVGSDEDVAARAADDLAGRMPEDALGRAVPVEDPSIRVDDEGAIPRARERLEEIVCLSPLHFRFLFFPSPSAGAGRPVGPVSFPLLPGPPSGM